MNYSHFLPHTSEAELTRPRVSLLADDYTYSHSQFHSLIDAVAPFETYLRHHRSNQN
jgi:hypothetical protein